MLTIANKGGCRNGNFSTKGSHVNKNVTKTAEGGGFPKPIVGFVSKY